MKTRQIQSSNTHLLECKISKRDIIQNYNTHKLIENIQASPLPRVKTVVV